MPSPQHTPVPAWPPCCARPRKAALWQTPTPHHDVAHPIGRSTELCRCPGAWRRSLRSSRPRHRSAPAREHRQLSPKRQHPRGPTTGSLGPSLASARALSHCSCLLPLLPPRPGPVHPVHPGPAQPRVPVPQHVSPGKSQLPLPAAAQQTPELRWGNGCFAPVLLPLPGPGAPSLRRDPTTLPGPHASIPAASGSRLPSSHSPQRDGRVASTSPGPAAVPTLLSPVEPLAGGRGDPPSLPPTRGPGFSLGFERWIRQRAAMPQQSTVPQKLPVPWEAQQAQDR